MGSIHFLSCHFDNFQAVTLQYVTSIPFFLLFPLQIRVADTAQAVKMGAYSCGSRGGCSNMSADNIHEEHTQEKHTQEEHTQEEHTHKQYLHKPTKQFVQQLFKCTQKTQGHKTNAPDTGLLWLKRCFIQNTNKRVRRCVLILYL